MLSTAGVRLSERYSCKSGVKTVTSGSRLKNLSLNTLSVNAVMTTHSRLRQHSNQPE